MSAVGHKVRRSRRIVSDVSGSVDANKIDQYDRTCTNCARMSIRRPTLTEMIFLESKKNRMMCSYGNEDRKQLDVVTGNVTTIKSSLRTCTSMRERDAICDLSGRLWIPSDEWKDKKENLLKVLKETR